MVARTPKWNDTITVQRSGEPNFFLELLDEETFKDEVIGVAQIDLTGLQSQVVSIKWYPLFHKQKPAGEILIELTFTSDGKGTTYQARLTPTPTRSLRLLRV